MTKKRKEKNTDWTEKLFVENPELFVPAIKKRVSQAEEEVSFLLDCLDENGFNPDRILDLNCGIGRHSIEMAKREIEVLGTDLSKFYIKTARKRAEKENLQDNVDFLVADMRNIKASLSKRKLFDGIINLWTSFGYYDEGTNEDILRQCSDLVKSGGFFALEIINRDWIVHNFEERGFVQIKDNIILEKRSLNLENSRAYNTWIYLIKDGENNFKKKEIEFNHRLWSLHELINMFERNGWKFEKAYPGFNNLKKNDSLLKSKRLAAYFSKK